MKKILVPFFLFLIFSMIVIVKAEVNTVEEKQLQQLKDKIATKVAQLREKNNKAIAGIVTEIKDNSIKLKTDDADIDVKLDDTITKYYQINGSQRKEIKFQDIDKGQYVIISGVVGDRRVDANSIYIDEQYLVRSGKITEVNKDDYYLTVNTVDKDNYTLDIETFTKKQILNIKTLELETVSFSKIKEGDTIHFVVKAINEEKEANRYPAIKILIIPQEYFIK